MNARERTETWSLVAGDVALDFVNTVGGNDSTAHLDAIADYGLLLLWSVRAGAVGQAQADRLMRRARRRRAEADEVMRRARALRTSLYELFSNLADGAEVGRIAGPWAQVRTEAATAVACAEPVADEDGIALSWERLTDLDAPLHPVAHSAAVLLTTPGTSPLRRCDRCRWLFLDESRNHRRRWCDMATCGLAEKMERQAERRRRESPGS